MNAPFFLPTAKMSELLEVDPELILLLSRWGIPLGFGEKTIETVCSEQQISANLFLLLCRIYADKHFIPDLQNLSIVEAMDLMRYLKASHTYYLKDRIPHIGNHLKRIAEQCGPPYGKLLYRFYDEYRMEVETHFAYEEETVFPYIQQLAEGKRNPAYSIGEFQKNHHNIEDKLHDLRNILVKYLPLSHSSPDSISITLDIYRLSEDMSRHALIEESVMVPFVQTLEKEVEGAAM